MEQKPEPFFRRGEEKQVEIKVDEILNAIAEGRDVDIECAIVEGHLDIKEVADKLKRDKDGKSLIQVSVNIRKSKIRGDANFSLAYIITRASCWPKPCV